AREYGISEATIYNWKKEYSPDEEGAKKLPGLIVQDYIEPISSLTRFYCSAVLMCLTIFNVLNIDIMFPFQDISLTEVIIEFISLFLILLNILPLLKNFFWRTIKKN
ncbi:MAG: hypothetical protein L0L22_12110, partial [Staphylococcus equorum]|nr:hypothetical protein [Staphylococcus equorum]